VWLSNLTFQSLPDGVKLFRRQELSQFVFKTIEGCTDKDVC
jgi:hypothetical protein